MRALQFVAPAADAGATTVSEVEAPVPGPGQVAIDVAWAGVNFKDVMQRRGDPGYVSSWPFVPGLEVSGTVRAVGADVSGDLLGRAVVAVAGVGGLAELAVADARLVAEVPSGVSLRDAAAAPGQLVSAALLLEDFGRLRAGDSLLVHSAAGGVGAAVAQLARHLGAARLVGVVGSHDRVPAAQGHGYDPVAVRSKLAANDVREVTAGRGVNLVLDPQGTTMLDLDLDVTAPGGRVILFGNAAGMPMDELPPVPSLMGRGLQVGGFSLAALMAGAPDVVASALSRALGYLARGILSPEITDVAGLEEVPPVHDALAAGTGRGKYVVSVNA